MSDDMNYGAPASLPPAAPPASPTPRRGPNRAATWSIAVLVVLALAVAGGLFTAWIVANMKAVPGPVAGASPTPHVTLPSGAAPSASGGASTAPTSAPLHTPTPLPSVAVTAPPFTYVVQPGDHLVNIANMFGVTVQDIMDLNGLTNPNRIQVGQELLIPGYGNQPTPKPTKSPKK